MNFISFLFFVFLIIICFIGIGSSLFLILWVSSSVTRYRHRIMKIKIIKELSFVSIFRYLGVKCDPSGIPHRFHNRWPGESRAEGGRGHGQRCRLAWGRQRRSHRRQVWSIVWRNLCPLNQVVSFTSSVPPELLQLRANICLRCCSLFCLPFACKSFLKKCKQAN